MKNFIFKIFLVLSIVVNISFAVEVEEGTEEHNLVKSFADKVAYGIFKAAWPTAKYKTTDVESIRKNSSGYDLIFKLQGNSRICLIGKCPLWFTLDIKTDSEFHIKDMEVLGYKSILAAPFQTSGSLAKAMLEANEK